MDSWNAQEMRKIFGEIKEWVSLKGSLEFRCLAFECWKQWRIRPLVEINKELRFN